VTTDREIVLNDRCTLRLLQVDSRNLTVPEEEILTIVEWTEPTPLPFAPPSVLGIVSVEGRMFTVIDAGAVFGNEALREPRFIVAFRGDEQLAIAVDNANDTLDIKAEEISKESDPKLIRGKVQVRGKEVALMNVNKLFAAVIQGTERRRRRL
jgi:chemotaxis signal transduction protein